MQCRWLYAQNSVPHSEALDLNNNIAQIVIFIYIYTFTNYVYLHTLSYTSYILKIRPP